MPGDDVIKLLEKVNKPLSRKEIANTLKKDVTLISHILRRLTKEKCPDVKIMELCWEEAKKLYGEENYKRCQGLRLFYVGEKDPKEIKNLLFSKLLC